jgi:hypothetical protein
MKIMIYNSLEYQNNVKETKVEGKFWLLVLL